MPSKHGGTPSRTTLLVQRASDFDVLLEGVGDAVVGAHAEGVIRFIRRWKEVPFGRGQLLTKRCAT
jgi:2C-methyl-D-erythritol 2,4-cyclodiphosphate synthase